MASVYTTKAQDRFFHLPDDADVASGPLEIRSLKGQTRSVDPAAVAAFEVTEARAKELVKDEVAAFTEKASSALAALGGVLRAARQQAVPVPGTEQSEPQNVVASFLGITPDQLRNDPAAVKEGMRSVLAGLGQAVADAASDSPKSKAATQERMRQVQSAFEQHEPSDGGQKLAEQFESLAQAVSDPATAQKVRDAASKLAQSTEALKARREALAEQLDAGDDA